MQESHCQSRQFGIPLGTHEIRGTGPDLCSATVPAETPGRISVLVGGLYGGRVDRRADR